MKKSFRTFEAVYEGGYLRPLEPIDAHEGLLYIVTVIDVRAANSKAKAPSTLRGKYRGYLSTTDEFARNKQQEKSLEL
jgi:predicted DNA-binding antitoxin AbrB/MazE fold protein